LDFRNRPERALLVSEIDLDVILGTCLPRTFLGEGMARTGDDAPAGTGKTDHRRVPDAAAGAGEQQRAARLICASRHRRSLSRIKPRLGPRAARSIAPKLDAVVQSEWTVVPELDCVRHYPIAAPEGRPRNRAYDVFRGIAGDRLFEGKPAFQRRRLAARPGTDLGKPRPGRVIGIGLRVGDRLDRPAYAHLSGKRFPVEGQGRPGRALKLLALSAV